jgi:hypothetical protein
MIKAWDEHSSTEFLGTILVGIFDGSSKEPSGRLKVLANLACIDMFS